MKILITDDISDNREMLGRLIQQYSRKYKVEAEVFYAQHGQECIDICNERSIDLIFMDIVMPMIDGLEATKIVKEQHPSIMIIVISSENDEEIKSKILQAGAEDYVLKPFSSVIMLSRLNNYNQLIASRNSISYQPKSINTFTHSVYSYQMKFFINNEDDLAQLWETLLVRLDFQKHITHLSDFVRLIFRLGNIQLNKSYRCNVFMEEDEHNFYFTIDNMKLLQADIITKAVQRCPLNTSHKLAGDFLSFALPRLGTETSSDKIMSTTETSIAPSSSITPAENILQVYDFLDKDTLNEFDFVISKLHTEIMMMGSSSLTLEDIDTMNEHIQQIASLLAGSNDSYVVSTALNELSLLLDDYSEPFLSMSNELSIMMISFINDLIMWKEMIFSTGAPSVDFLDSSISSNVHMIRAVFVSDDHNAEELEDIFDF
ncbi:response regulator [Sulfurimonas sp. MAG313]|nr:response regulator [Sulfurimonas sp. MAG313]MDF1881156.1 response regulator [Sulfurimonas sp. MAG313]